ncbi:MAG: hypothetical protein CMJ53_08335 [Planctomycetaceae bacterium]|nr:hypothetical protein [Planctomycetaceae bacterium]
MTITMVVTGPHMRKKSKSNHSFFVIGINDQKSSPFHFELSRKTDHHNIRLMGIVRRYTRALI